MAPGESKYWHLDLHPRPTRLVTGLTSLLSLRPNLLGPQHLHALAERSVGLCMTNSHVHEGRKSLRSPGNLARLSSSSAEDLEPQPSTLSDEVFLFSIPNYLYARINLCNGHLPLICHRFGQKSNVAHGFLSFQATRYGRVKSDGFVERTCTSEGMSCTSLEDV
jgi:hypothetical protein